MNKLQPSPLPSTRGTPLHQPIGPWGSPPVHLDNMRFFRAWLVFDSEGRDSEHEPRPGKEGTNWNLIGGVALMTLVSAAGWAGIALLISRFWK
jgi:hypothetical protein